ncbi:MAG: amino acid adenylation domain-containing protein, partial [Lachnospiraceae bacterium]|nr:amino acid adenylation domain-containing protein [Lachnospiraceae bacterium]
KNYGNAGGTAKDKAAIIEKFGADNVERIYRLQDVQKGMLYHSLEKAGNNEYKMQYRIHMGFYMDAELAEEAINVVSDKYAALRTSIVYKKVTEPMQVVLKNRKPIVEVVEVNGDITEELVNEYVERDLNRALDLEDSPLFAVTILNNYKTMEMIWNFHHILMDGWSLPVVFGDFHQYYENLLYGEDIDYRPTDSYERHINKLYTRDIKAGMKFWSEYLSDYDDDTYITPINPAKDQGNAKERFTKVLSDKVQKSVQKLANSLGTTVNTIIEATLGIVLQKYNCSDDVVFGKVTSGRDLTVDGVEREVGLFVNTLPVRVKNEGYTVRELLEKVKENDINSNKYEYCSLSQIIREIGNNPIRIIYAYENFMNADALMDNLDGIESKNLRDDTNYDISFVINNTNKLEWNITYNTSIYGEEEIARLADCIERVMTELPKNLNKPVAEVGMVSKKDTAIITKKFNDTLRDYPGDKTVSELFKEAVDKYPDNIALRYYDESYTYTELDKLSDEYATELKSHGISEGHNVCFMAYKEVKTIAYIIAILKLGGVYIPLDPHNPPERIKYIIENSDAVAVLDPKGENKFFDEKILPNKKENREVAYMMYTSGTSGEPKACVVLQKGIVRLVKNTNYMQLDETTRMMSGSSMAFDASTLEIWGTLLNGGTLALMDTDDMMTAQKLEEFTRRYDINTMFITTALFNQLMDSDPTILGTLRELATGGEKMSEKHAKLFMDNHPNTKFMNVYGPTENTTFTTFGEVDLNRITLGKPITNSTVYIMNGGELAPIGVYGELVTGGEGVARGYYKNEELTKKVFVKNPFGAGVLYRTGDKARFLPNGEIEFAGRIDHQVKIRGFRIEPEEISKKVQEIDSIVSCVTVIDGEKKIKAYYVASKEMDNTEIFDLLKEKLPDYMVPRYYMQLDEIPVNINGKTDYKRLPDIAEPIKRQYVAPVSDDDKKIVNAFERILDIDNIGMEDDFIELGGNSLMAVRLANEIEEVFGQRIELRHIMEERTPAKILGIIKTEGRAVVAIPKAEVKDEYEMSSVQKRMFILQKTNPETTQYNIPIVLSFKEKMDIEKLTGAVKELVRRHEALRTKFYIKDEAFFQNVTDENIEVTVYANTPFDEVWEKFLAPFDLEKELPFRAAILVDKSATYLLMDMHHSIADGASTTIIMKDLLTLYRGGELPEQKFQYKDYSEWLKTYDFEKEKEYWLKEFADEVTPLDLPYDFERGKRKTYAGNTIKKSITSEDIKYIAEKCHVTEYAVLMAAWFMLLKMYTRQEDMTVGTPVVGRVHSEINDTVGMFVNTIPVRVSQVEGLTLEEFIKSLGEKTIKAFENQEYPLYEMIDALGIPRNTDREPLFDVLFAVRDQREESILTQFGAENVELTGDTAKFDLTMEVQVNKENYVLGLEYSTDLFLQDTAERILNNYACALSVMKDNLQSLTEDIEIIDAEEKETILTKFNDTFVPYENNVCVDEVFDRYARKNPDKIAIGDENKEVTYKEASEITDRVAAELRKLGVRHNDAVAIEAERSADTILLFIATLKAGAVYVPIESDMPAEKIKYMLDNCNAKVIIAGSKDKFKSAGVRYIDRDGILNGTEDIRFVTPAGRTSVDCMYYLYTSGTTGNPKATMITHRNIMRTVQDRVGGQYDEDDVALLSCSLAFDGSAHSIWGTLLNGATLRIIPVDVIVDHKKFHDRIVKYGVNSLLMTTALFNKFVEDDPTMFAQIKHLRVGGEKLSDKHVRRFQEVNKETVLLNVYGPTENTIFTSVYEVPVGFEKMTIGKPIDNTQVYILQKNSMVGIGVYGELCTTGEGVGKGYLNNEKLTKEKFVPNPYGGGTMYRTGDLARFLPDGNIDFLGRIDSQVKIRGFRIELTGIESVLREYPGISQAAVVAYQGKELKAYFASDEEIDIYELFNWMKTKLPSYMVPSYYMRVESFPLTMNGKLDYRKLPENNEVVKTKYVAPETETEKAIAAMFAELLELEEVGAEDNYFEVGGNSLKATLLCNKIGERLHKAVNVGDIFACPTVRQLAELTDQAPELTEEDMTADADKEYVEFYTQPYQYNAFADYVIQAHPDYEDWTQNNYIQLIGNAEVDAAANSTIEYFTGTVFGKLPMLKIQDIAKRKKKALKLDTPEVKEELADYILGAVSKGKKSYLFFDHYYIKSSEAYLKAHQKHDVMIIDYADDKVSYFENVGGMYTKFVIDKEEFMAAYFGTNDACTFILSPNKKFSYKFDMDRFITMLEDYTYARDSRVNEDMYLTYDGFVSKDFYGPKDKGIKNFGIKTYETVKKYSLAYKETSIGFDYRMYYLLFEHDRRMVEKLNYCCEHGYADYRTIGKEISELGELTDTLYQILTKAIQFNYVTPTDEQVEEITDRLMEAYKREKVLYEELLNKLCESQNQKTA